jgi:uncharacterized protein
VRQGSELYGKAFENWVFHELNCYNSYRGVLADFSFWQLSGGTEVDFIVNDMECAIEVKASGAIASHHLKGLRELARDHPEVKRRVLLSAEPRDRRTPDGIDILSVRGFLRALWEGRLF